MVLRNSLLILATFVSSVFAATWVNVGKGTYAAVGGPVELASDSFNRANADPIGGNWTTVGSMNGLRINTNVVQPQSNDYGADSGAIYNAVVWPDNQYSQAAISGTGTIGGGTGFGVCIRASTSAQTAYTAVVDATGSNNLTVGKFVSGTFTTLQTSTVSYVAGQTLKLQASGSTLKVFYNSVQIGGDISDASIASGNAGIYYSSTNDISANADDWSGGSL